VIIITSYLLATEFLTCLCSHTFFMNATCHMTANFFPMTEQIYFLLITASHYRGKQLEKNSHVDVLLIIKC